MCVLFCGLLWDFRLECNYNYYSREFGKSVLSNWSQIFTHLSRATLSSLLDSNFNKQYYLNLRTNILTSSSYNKATLSFVSESVLDLLSPTLNTGIIVQFTVIVYITLHL